MRRKEDQERYLSWKKNRSPKPLKRTEREELIRLREENQFIKKEIENIKAETEVIKKLISLEARKMGCATQGEKAAIIKET